MTIARLRLFLAILALMLAPLWGPATAGVAPAAMVTAEDGCDHACTPGILHHQTAACALSCAVSAGMPLLAAAVVVPMPSLAVARPHSPQILSLSATRWPPPERPPRA